jgi:hypothetical protein
MRLKTFVTTAVVAAFPFAASAASVDMLQMRIGGPDGTVILDNDALDDDPALGSLVLVDTPATGLTGFDLAVATGSRLEGPPLDQFFADVRLTNASAEEKSVLIEITANFQNPEAGPQWPGAFSATINDVTDRSDWLVQTWIGSTAYDRGVLAIQADTTVTALSRIELFNPRNYWITHLFDNTSPPGTSSGANADFVAPIPVPAAGFLLLAALGGFAALRRRERA